MRFIIAFPYCYYAIYCRFSILYYAILSSLFRFYRIFSVCGFLSDDFSARSADNGERKLNFVYRISDIRNFSFGKSSEYGSVFAYFVNLDVCRAEDNLLVSGIGNKKIVDFIRNAAFVRAS